MRLVFIHHVLEDRGSAQDMFHYERVARELGHEVVLFGRPGRATPFNYTTQVSSADAAVFIFEFTTELQYGDLLAWATILAKVPRSRRVVIDCDGKYNDAIQVVGDINHARAEQSREWIEICDSLSDTILQPTYHPLRPNVKPFFFHGYDPSWEVPLDFDNKEFGMVYVGNNWFRWRGLSRVLDTIEPVLQHVGRIAIVGNGWDHPAPWAKPVLPEDAYYHDAEYLRRLGVRVIPPIRFDEVIGWMSRGLFSPVIYRPLFDHLQLVTCRTFETPAANTIPLLCQERQFVEDVYGPAGLELVLPQERPQEKIMDLFENRQKYLEVVRELRRVLRQRYSYAARVRELVERIGE
jgi:SAM-dependent methyltransferase